MITGEHHKMTQRRIAELAGVSQATVSLVLNGKADALSRIPEETRQRVMDVIQETTYVADPAARRLAGAGNNILGVFTYEPAFPSEGLDFYTPLFTGIEAEAESIGCDLLMFTSAPVENGRRRIFHENNRLGLADGCLLLGLEMDGVELARLVASGYPFVSVGRRDAEGVPYVGVDYAAGTATLVRTARDLGHQRFFYLHFNSDGESVRDRLTGWHREVDGVRFQTRAANDLAADWTAIKAFAPSVLFVEAPADADALHELALADGIEIPKDLSMVVLGEASRTRDQAIDFTRLSPPRSQLGANAVTLLSRILSPTDLVTESELRVLLDCPIVDGSTLTPPSSR